MVNIHHSRIHNGKARCVDVVRSLFCTVHSASLVAIVTYHQALVVYFDSLLVMSVGWGCLSCCL